MLKGNDSPTTVLDDEEIKKDLRGRTLKGGYVTAGSQAIKFVLGLVASAVLARLLDPRDFGLLAMAAAFTGSVGVFMDMGFSTATVQRQHITHSQISNLFWINLATGVSVTLILVAIAPLVSAFFAEPALKNIVIVMAFAFTINALGAQHSALLTREMKFGVLARREIACLILSQGVAILLAFRGWGVWALVASTLVSSAFVTASLWQVSVFRPSKFTMRVGTRSLVSFGANLTGVNLLNQLTRRVDSVLIGKVLGSDSAGLYSKASSLLKTPISQLLAPLSSVFRPTLSRVQDDPERFRRVFLKLYQSVALFTLPVTAACVGLAEPIILVLYGEKWRSAIPVFAALALSAAYLPLANTANLVFVTQGRTGELLRTQFWLSIQAALAIAACLPFGLTAVALGYSASGLLIRMPFQFFRVGRRGAVRTKDLWAGLLKSLPIWVAVYLSAAGIVIAMRDFGEVVQLSLGGLASVFIAVVLSWVHPSLRATIKELLAVVRAARPSKSPE